MQTPSSGSNCLIASEPKLQLPQRRDLAMSQSPIDEHWNLFNSTCSWCLHCTRKAAPKQMEPAWDQTNDLDVQKASPFRPLSCLSFCRSNESNPLPESTGAECLPRRVASAPDLTMLANARPNNIKKPVILISTWPKALWNGIAYYK